MIFLSRRLGPVGGVSYEPGASPRFRATLSPGRMDGPLKSRYTPRKTQYVMMVI